MNGTDRLPRVLGAVALVVSIVCVAPGGAASSNPQRGPTPGGCCDVTGTFDLTFSVKLDPAQHHAVIQLRDGRVVVVRLSDGTFRVTGNRSATIPATAPSASSTGCGFPLFNGSGTVAGFPNVTGRYKDLGIAGDAIEGLLELGVGGELPGGQAICYEFVGTRNPSVPDAGEAMVNLAVQFTLLLAQHTPAKPRPGYFFGFGPNVFPGLGAGRFLYRSDGMGGFIPAGQLPLVTGHNPLAVAAIDRSGGGAQDLAVISRPESDGDTVLNIFTQTPTGTFDRTQVLSLGVTYSGGVYVSTGDLDGDGTPDIVTAGTGGSVDVFRSSGGTFTHSQTLDLGQPIVGLIPGFWDFDGDGATDAAAVSNDLDAQTLFINSLLGDGAGALAPGPTTPNPFCADDSFLERFKYAVGDVNADGRPDIVAVGEGGACPPPGDGPFGISLLNQTNDPGTFLPQTPFEVLPGLDTSQLTLFTPPCAGTPAIIANGGVYLGTGTGGFMDSGVDYQLNGNPPFLFSVSGVNQLTGMFFEGDQLAIQTRSLEELGGRPVLTGVRIVGKSLFVDGSGFEAGSRILVDGVAYKTKPDRNAPTTTLSSKKALKKVPVGTPVTVQVQGPDGVVTESVVFTR